jgi:isoleucyl-tRNA synthetase
VVRRRQTISTTCVRQTEILQRVTDGYRKLRNTARFALGNLSGFDPAQDSVPFEKMEEIDRWALAELDRVLGKVLAAYESYEFHLVYHALYNFATVTLSARYFDIIKDRLYTFAPPQQSQKVSTNCLVRIADTLARMLGPILVFTADEIWENLPGQSESQASVHLEEFPKVSGVEQSDLSLEWERLFEIRDQVLRVLEEARVGKQIGSSLEAKVALSASGGTLELLRAHQNDLRYIFIVSQVELLEGDELSISVSRAAGEKCERCWNYSTRVGRVRVIPDRM